MTGQLSNKTKAAEESLLSFTSIYFRSVESVMKCSNFNHTIFFEIDIFESVFVELAYSFIFDYGNSFTRSREKGLTKSSCKLEKKPCDCISTSKNMYLLHKLFSLGFIFE